ncbi:MAG: DUF1194 domain-containing protein [Rhodobacteraceae bacterium]|nr:DUF1194 domain-containing protein [Paracoccaceae bacterium]
MLRVLTVFLLALTKPVAACQLALVLAIDVSSSIDSGEYRFQVDGLAEALLSQEIMDVLMRDQVALSVVQWSGRNEQEMSIPWRRMLTMGEITNFAARVQLMPRNWSHGKTAVGDAIAFSVNQFSAVSDCGRRVIDVSGDGNSNSGTDTGNARRLAERAGIEINGLAIDRMGVSITEYFRRFVVTSQGFVLTSQGYSDYPRTIRAKLLRELVKPSS